MSDSPSPTPEPTPTPEKGAAPASPPAPASSGLSLTRLALFAVAAVAIYLFIVVGPGMSYYQKMQMPEQIDTASQLREYLKQQGRFAKMADAYKDADKDLVADAPTDPAKLINPAELTFTTVVLDDPDEAEKIWQPFMDHVAKTTGKKVKYLKVLEPSKDEKDATPSPLRATDQQLDAVRDGKLHITAFNTGLVQGAVNTAGFVPLFAPADKDGKFSYKMQIIVPAKSSVMKVGDLSSKSLEKTPIAFVAMSSNSGAKAPLVLLKEEFQMLPGAARQYEFLITGEHSVSIRGVSEGKYPAASVAGDILDRMTAKSPIVSRATLPADGKLTGDIKFTAELDGAKKTVTLSKAKTDDNKSVEDLLKDAQAAMVEAGIPAAAVEVSLIEKAPKQRLEFELKGANSFAIDVGPTDPMVTQLGFRPHQRSPEVDPTTIRSIYPSKDFPPLCFGVPHNLDPKLRADIQKAFETFQFEGNSVGDRYASQNRVKFAKVNYQKDWEYVREIDEKLTHLLDK